MGDEPSTSKNVDNIQVNLRTSACKVKHGGINCCVPHCTNNNIKNPEISFHKIPKDEALQKKFVKLLKTKGLKNIGPNSRVSSSHFPGGRKKF
jgi:hypothetical protein